eukprot:Awhi_evm1s6226
MKFKFTPSGEGTTVHLLITDCTAFSKYQEDQYEFQNYYYMLIQSYVQMHARGEISWEKYESDNGDIDATEVEKEIAATSEPNHNTKCPKECSDLHQTDLDLQLRYFRYHHRVIYKRDHEQHDREMAEKEG